MIRRRNDATLADAFAGLRADYSAAKSSRFRRKRSGVASAGAGADYHYRGESDYLRMVEYARDMDRNDLIVGQTVDRAVTNTIQDGFRHKATTGDDKLDDYLEGRWTDWSEDPDACDLAGELTFWEMENLVLRQSLVDGDDLALPNDSGALELVEGHRLRTPRNANRNKNYAMVHGVRIDDNRKRLEYWLTKNDIEPSAPLTRIGDVRKIPARDEQGNRQVFHVMAGKRISQTRGVTAFAPMFDALGMFEDINFATLVQRQMVACFAVFRERALEFQLPGAEPAHGPQTEETTGSYTKILEGIGPGMEIGGLPGEKLSMNSPNVPNAEFFPHMRLLLTLIGVNLGMPLVMMLLDASETNFSGWRGAVDQARMGFRGNQRRLKNRFHKPVYQWKVRQWMESDSWVRNLSTRETVKIFAHEWQPPTWPYIEPLKDASADLLRTRNALISQRRRCGERGMQWSTLSTEIVEDNALLIRKAAEMAQTLNQEFPGLGVTWREVACLPTPDGVKVSLDAGADEPAGRADRTEEEDA